MALLGTVCVRANPTGGAVIAGGALINGQGTSTVIINQSTNTAIINWQTFSIGSGELTQFIQPSSSSATLNRVLGGQTSFINGTLSANGQIYLLNGNGIVVGPGGVINTAGFTGSTRDISDSDFLSGNLHFVGSGDGRIKNLGTITALGGDVVLIGKTVENRGTINATGTAGLVAGDDIYLAQKNADGSTITVNPVSAPTTAGGKIGVNNTGVINASSAELKAANGNIYALAIQNKGVVRATTLTQQGGHIYLTSDSGTVVNSGTLDASATAAGGQGGTVLVKSAAGKVVHSGKIIARGGQGGVGGNAEISGPQFSFTGTVDLTSPGGTTGNLLLDPGLAHGGRGQRRLGCKYLGRQRRERGFRDHDRRHAGRQHAQQREPHAQCRHEHHHRQRHPVDERQHAHPEHQHDRQQHRDQRGRHRNRGRADPPHRGRGRSDLRDRRGQCRELHPAARRLGAERRPEHDDGRLAIAGLHRLQRFRDPGWNIPAHVGREWNFHALSIRRHLWPAGSEWLFKQQCQPRPESLDLRHDRREQYVDLEQWKGFAPIGSTANPYQGTFGNTGGTINNLTINQPEASDAVGLFSVIGTSGSVYYVSVNNASITGNNNVGAIAGTNLGLIYNASSNNGTVNGNTNVGGLAGENDGTLDYGFTENVTASRA